MKGIEDGKACYTAGIHTFFQNEEKSQIFIFSVFHNPHTNKNVKAIWFVLSSNVHKHKIISFAVLWEKKTSKLILKLFAILTHFPFWLPRYSGSLNCSLSSWELKRSNIFVTICVSFVFWDRVSMQPNLLASSFFLNDCWDHRLESPLGYSFVFSGG